MLAENICKREDFSYFKFKLNHIFQKTGWLQVSTSKACLVHSLSSRICVSWAARNFWNYLTLVFGESSVNSRNAHVVIGITKTLKGRSSPDVLNCSIFHLTLIQPVSNLKYFLCSYIGPRDLAYSASTLIWEMKLNIGIHNNGIYLEFLPS